MTDAQGPARERQRRAAVSDVQPARSRPTIQAKLVVGAAADAAEREAERVADEVMRAFGSRSARPGDVGEFRPDSAVSRIRRAPSIGAAGGQLDVETEQTLERARAGGVPLVDPVRRQMESAFGADLSAVRMHVGTTSDALNDALGARAFTSGSDVFVRRADYAPHTESGQHLIAHELAHTLQQGAVSRSVRRALDDVGPGSESQGGTASADREIEEEAAEAETDSADESEIVISVGTITGDGKNVIAEEVGKEDAGALRGRSTPGHRPGAAATTQRVEWAPDLGLSSSIVERPARSGRDAADVVSVSRLQTRARTQGGMNVNAFGSESTDFRFENVNLHLRKGQIRLTGDMVGTFSWGVNSGGKVDVPSATAPVVTADNYQQIASDLSPTLVEKSWRAPRSVYWSKAICERHEQFHASDDTQWFHSRALGILRKYLRANPVDLTGVDTNDKSAVLNQATPELRDSIQVLSAANMDFYKGGATSYFSYAGEERAFGDGKAPYEELAAAVTARGPALERSARVKAWNKDWEQKTAQARGNPVNSGPTP